MTSEVRRRRKGGDLDGAALAVAMRGSVHGCHAPHADQAVQAPFAAQHGPHALLGAFDNRVGHVVHGKA